MKITIEMLVAKSACEPGMEWVRKNLPTGAEYREFIEKLEAAKHMEWADWLISNFGVEVLAEKWRIDSILQATKGKKDSDKDSAKIGSSGHYAKIGSSGDSAKIGSSGYYAKIGSSGDSAKIGSSGHSAQIGSSGDSAQIGSSGDSAQIGSSGDSAQIGSSGDSAQIGSSGHSAKIGSSGDSAKIEASGKNSVIASAGYGARAKAGENGCIALAWWDGERPRMAVGYVGEGGIQSDKWYVVKNGQLKEEAM